MLHRNSSAALMRCIISQLSCTTGIHRWEPQPPQQTTRACGATPLLFSSQSLLLQGISHIIEPNVSSRRQAVCTLLAISLAIKTNVVHKFMKAQQHISAF